MYIPAHGVEVWGRVARPSYRSAVIYTRRLDGAAVLPRLATAEILPVARTRCLYRNACERITCRAHPLMLAMILAHETLVIKSSDPTIASPFGGRDGILHSEATKPQVLGPIVNPASLGSTILPSSSLRGAFVGRGDDPLLRSTLPSTASVCRGGVQLDFSDFLKNGAAGSGSHGNNNACAVDAAPSARSKAARLSVWRIAEE
jgi:hypothetical protein